MILVVDFKEHPPHHLVVEAARVFKFLAGGEITRCDLEHLQEDQVVSLKQEVLTEPEAGE